MSPGRRRFEIEDSVFTPASAAAVMRQVKDPVTWPKWQSEIVSTDGRGPVEEGAVVEGRARLLGFHVDGRSSIVRTRDDELEEDVIVGVRMQVVYRVAPATDGTVITHRMRAELPMGPAGTILSWLLARRLRTMQKDLLRALRAQAEGADS